MSLIDIRCVSETCGEVTEVYRAASDWPATPPCPKCDSPTEQAHLPRAANSSAPAVVVYQMSDGSYRFPAGVNGPMAAHYDKLGATRIELRGWQEIRPFEQRMNKLEYAKICQRVERGQAGREAHEKQRRSDFQNEINNGVVVPVLRRTRDGQVEQIGTRIVHLSERGKALARATIARNNQKPGIRTYDPGFRVEAYSENRSNRSDGRRERD